jgi:c(7)-type cytochrome triheme protein
MERETQNKKSHAHADNSSANIVRSPARRRAISLVLMLAFVAVFVASVLHGLVARAKPSTVPVSAAAVAQGGKRFSHSIRQHAETACESCHQRSSDPHPHLPGHKACIECHATDFTTPQSPLCLGCHTNVESSNPPLKAFPGLTDFGMRFDHARHMTGGAKPEKGCASCHLPVRRGIAVSIPGGFTAHQNCYQCHSPNSQAGGRSISTCSLCHAQGSYSRPSTGAKAYNVSFSHATHSARQKLSCEECHQVRAGAPQTQQVASPQPTQHFGSGRGASCMTCHNGRRAFGGDNFADCKRCHTGQTFHF